ncbi:MAG: TorF family putative porin [Betaproteobacteria bacterium]|nr:TorF family putative porin [Betaproteobacteria bacterium]MDE2358027.1 TorF family putative porin [Betaproteobacteria bacterium]
MLAAFWNCANGQVSGTLSAISDYRYRGITLSDRKPAAQVTVAYDDSTGWYLGAFASTVRLAPPADAHVQGVAFGGYAFRMPSGLSLEAGGDYATFAAAGRDDYGEVFLGAASESVSARVYYAPRYFGLQSNAVYGELNALLPINDRVHLLAHFGMLRTAYPAGYQHTTARMFVDGRIGLGVDFSRLRLEIAWVGTNDAYAAYPLTGASSPNTVVLSLTRSF